MREETLKPAGNATNWKGEMDSFIIAKFTSYLTELTEDTENYLADEDRQRLLSAFCRDTGAHTNSLLAKLFLVFVDGMDAGAKIIESLLTAN